jgi:signal transduction histidine kinase
MPAEDVRSECGEANDLDGPDVAQLVHALRNPLTAILIGSQHLAGLDLGKLPTATAACIARSAKHLAQLIDELERLARMQAKGRP